MLPDLPLYHDVQAARNESANAEIIGVVILIGIFAITAGIISATTLASPQPVKVYGHVDRDHRYTRRDPYRPPRGVTR